MSNRAFLIANHSPDTPGQISPEASNYDPNTEVLAACGTPIPVCWLGLFSTAHVKPHKYAGQGVPTLVAKAADAKQLYANRRDQIEWLFPDNTDELQLWDQLLEQVDAPFFKIDFAEIWDLDAEEFESNLGPALGWFDSGEKSDFRAFLRFTALGYDRKKQKILIDMDSDAEYHLRGYGWVRPAPWDK